MSNPVPPQLRTAARTGLHDIAAKLLPGLVLLALVKDQPNETEDSLVKEVSGDLKHVMRQKIGFAVDLLWNTPDWTRSLDADIRKAINQVKGEQAE